jgi:hypothetical protein
VETLLYIVYRVVLIPCSHLLAILAKKKDRKRFAKRDGYGAANAMKLTAKILRFKDKKLETVEEVRAADRHRLPRIKA